MAEITGKLMLTIDQISQLTGVRKSTLRYWEKTFEEFLKPARTQSNRREYTMEELEKVKVIQQLLEKEHLTPYGVRLRLQEIGDRYGGNGGQKSKSSSRKRDFVSSITGIDPSI